MSENRTDDLDDLYGHSHHCWCCLAWMADMLCVESLDTPRGRDRDTAFCANVQKAGEEMAEALVAGWPLFVRLKSRLILGAGTPRRSSHRRVFRLAMKVCNEVAWIAHTMEVPCDWEAVTMGEKMTFPPGVATPESLPSMIHRLRFLDAEELDELGELIEGEYILTKYTDPPPLGKSVFADRAKGVILVDGQEYEAKAHQCTIVAALVEADGLYVTGPDMQSLPGCKSKKFSREFDALEEEIPSLKKYLRRGDKSGYRMVF